MNGFWVEKLRFYRLRGLGASGLGHGCNGCHALYLFFIPAALARIAVSIFFSILSFPNTQQDKPNISKPETLNPKYFEPPAPEAHMQGLDCLGFGV